LNRRRKRQKEKDQMTDFGTDNGPTCSRCHGTIWAYSFDRYGVATCCGCHMVEGPLRLRSGGSVLPKPATAVEAREMHEGFRKES
jgi:hypothetical protein